ncbi:MAG TPA: LuxR C-terminal-related transcriptional regulator, partial [Acidimicrobiia bacterium]|nr:LuxR C-terminal-related transcriptional regulator [Acidimicrobiia bacterium]
ADLLRRSAAALLERAEGRRLALVVDDAHLLDDASATLIHQLAGSDSAFVLATLRTGEVAPEPVTSLWKDGVVERLELVGLDARAVAQLLESVLRGPVDRATVAHLAVRCQGNVLFLRELVLGALHDGSLCDDGGIWRLVAPLCPSERLVELVEARLGRLDGAERRLLELVSFGEPLGPAELRAVADPGVAEALEWKGLLVSRRDAHRVEVRLGHPLYGDVLRSRVSALRVPEIARSLAEAVEAMGARRREDTLRVATWRLQGGGAQPDRMLAAATTARWRYDFPLAERLATAAIEAGAGFDAELLAAQLACLEGRAEEAHNRLPVLAGKATDDAQRGLVAVSDLDALAIYAGRMDEGLRVAEEAESAIADPVWRGEIAAKRAVILLGLQGPRAAAEVAEDVLAHAQGRALVWASMIGSFSVCRLGRIDDALEMSDRGYAAHLALTQPMDWYPWIHPWLRCEALALSGRFSEAETLAMQYYQQGLAEGSTEAQAFFCWHLALVVGERGRVQTAARHAREGIALFRELGRPHYVAECLIGLALALALAQRVDEAAETLAALDHLAVSETVFKPVERTQARAWTAAAAGDLPTARRLLAEAADDGERIGDRIGEVSALHGLARLGKARAVIDRLERVAQSIEGNLAPARAAHARALVKEDPEGLLVVSEAFGAMGADLLAAEAAADAAVAWRRSNDSRRAAAAERRAAELASRCEGASTPALQAIGTRARLTPVEREVALLAAGGRSNKQVAQELFLATRTVENHLQHVYEKLGISGRTELAGALQAIGAPVQSPTG